MSTVHAHITTRNAFSIRRPVWGFGAAGAAGLLALGGLAAPATGDGGVSVGLAVAAITGIPIAAEGIVGARSWAVGQADGVWVSDPAGVSIAQYINWATNTNRSIARFPMTDGGWLSASASSIADAQRFGGSRITTTSEANIGAFFASASVNYTNRVLGPEFIGTQPGYFGHGQAFGGFLARDIATAPVRQGGRPGPDNGGPGGGSGPEPEMQTLGFSYALTLDSMTLDLTDAIASGGTGVQTAGFRVDVAAFDSAMSVITPDDIPGLDDAVFAGVVASEFVTLSVVEGVEQGLSFGGGLLHAGLFSGSDGLYTLIDPLVLTLTFEVVVPAAWDEVDLRIDAGYDDQIRVVPAPAGAVVLAALGVLAVRRRR